VVNVGDNGDVTDVLVHGAVPSGDSKNRRTCGAGEALARRKAGAMPGGRRRKPARDGSLGNSFAKGA
jgi:hypothetical protein